MNSRRVYTAIVFIPLFFVLVQYLPPFAFVSFVTAGICIGLYEFYRLRFKGEWLVPSVLIGLAVGSGIPLYVFYGPSLQPTAAIITLLTVVLVGYLATAEPPAVRMSTHVIILFGLLYIGWLLSHLLLLRQFECGIALIFFLFFVTWATDTAAFYAGTFWGQHKLAPRISPGKTVEGAVWGVFGAVAMAFGAKAWFVPWLHPLDCLILGLLLGSLGQLGDLFESLLKRRADVKDSGTMIPGHGGLLDRVDSLIFNAPTLYYYVLIIKGGTREFCT